MALAAVVLVGVYARSRRRGAHASEPIRWSDHDMRTFVAEVGPIGVPIPAVLAVYAAESGLDPKASSGIAWGLCQALERTLRQVGWTKRGADFGKLTVAQQAPWIAKVLAMQCRAIGFVPSNALDLYVANFAPFAAAQKADVIYRKGSKAYDANIGLDRDGKGYIARSDLATSLKIAESTAAYKLALEQYRRIAPPETKATASNGN